MLVVVVLAGCGVGTCLPGCLVLFARVALRINLP